MSSYVSLLQAVCISATDSFTSKEFWVYQVMLKAARKKSKTSSKQKLTTAENKSKTNFVFLLHRLSCIDFIIDRFLR